MNTRQVGSVALLATCLVGASLTASAQTLKKIDDSNKITVSYRESSIPFSYLPSAGSKPVGAGGAHWPLAQRKARAPAPKFSTTSPS